MEFCVIGQFREACRSLRVHWSAVRHKQGGTRRRNAPPSCADLGVLNVEKNEMTNDCFGADHIGLLPRICRRRSHGGINASGKNAPIVKFLEPVKARAGSAEQPEHAMHAAFQHFLTGAHTQGQRPSTRFLSLSRSEALQHFLTSSHTNFRKSTLQYMPPDPGISKDRSAKSIRFQVSEYSVCKSKYLATSRTFY